MKMSINSRSTELLILGGGVLGLGIAWDASLRGIKALVIEQGDLGQGTSGRYHGLLHSGARYAVSDPSSAQECAQENSILRRIATAAIEDTGGLFLSTPADPDDYAMQWLQACRSLRIPVEEISPSKALRSHPCLNKDLRRAFTVADASLDSFYLLRALAQRIDAAGGQVWLRHRALKLIHEGSSIVGAIVQRAGSNQPLRIQADLTINATGAWAQQLLASADLAIPTTLSKGTLIAFASRPVHTVVNRCRPPSDGDILVPVGSVAIAGTTDIPVDSPSQLTISPGEVDLLLASARILCDLSDSRPLRAWAGIRALPLSGSDQPDDPRTLSRSYALLDHRERHSLEGLLTIAGGKLTTYRLIAERVTDLAASRLGHTRPCQTREATVTAPPRRYHTLPRRGRREAQDRDPSPPGKYLCQCERVTTAEVEDLLDQASLAELDDLRRALRVGMGPCQSAFCMHSSAAAMAHSDPHFATADGMKLFAAQRWRGLLALAWGQSLAQVELMRRVHIDTLSMHQLRGEQQ